MVIDILTKPSVIKDDWPSGNYLLVKIAVTTMLNPLQVETTNFIILLGLRLAMSEDRRKLMMAYISKFSEDI